MRKVQFANGEYYHLFNRGVDKREIFLDQKDLDRFLQSMSDFIHLFRLVASTPHLSTKTIHLET